MVRSCALERRLVTSVADEGEEEGGVFSGVEEMEEVVERVGFEGEGDAISGMDLGLRWKRLERNFRLGGRGVESAACCVDKFVNQVCKSLVSSSGLVSRNPQYDLLRKNNGFSRAPNSSGNTESKYLQ